MTTTSPLQIESDIVTSRRRRFSESTPWTIACGMVAVLLTALVLWPIIDVGRSALDLVWRPSGDWAVLVLRVEDVGELTPLVGPYSRFGWNHPGPLLYWLLAAPYHLFGDKPEAILAAAAALNACTVAGLSAVAWRRGRLPLVAVTMAATAILLHAMGPAMLRDPWNPFITLLPLALIVFLVWSVAEGDAWMWPPLAFVVSFELQSHIGYLPILIVLAATLLVLTWRRRRFTVLLSPIASQRRWVAVSTVIVILLCWTPVLIDQFFETGNMGAIASYFASPGDDSAGFATALHIAADQLRIPSAPWLGRSELAGGDGALLGSAFAALLIPILAMLAAATIAIRTRSSSALRFQLFAVAAGVGGLLATARVLGPLFDWVVRWWWVIACLWWLSITWTLWTALLQRVPSGRDRLLTGFLSIAAALIVMSATTPVIERASTTPPPSPSVGIVLDEFLQPTLESLRGSGPLLVITTGSVRGDYGDALRLQLERAGVDVVAEKNMLSHLGSARSESERAAIATLWIVTADQIPLFRADPSMRELGGWDPLTPEERGLYFLDESILQEQLIAAGHIDLAEALTNGDGGVDTEATRIDGVDQDLLRRVEAIRRMGDPVAVFLGPARP